MSSADKVGAFIGAVLLVHFILGLAVCYIDSVIERWKQKDMERFLKSCPPPNDEQKRKADPARPVRSESDCGKYLCEGRIELLEKVPASGSDIPQSIDGSGSISFSGEIEVSRKNEKC